MSDDNLDDFFAKKDKSKKDVCKDSHTLHIESGSKSNTNSHLQSQFSHRI